MSGVHFFPRVFLFWLRVSRELFTTHTVLLHSYVFVEKSRRKFQPAKNESYTVAISRDIFGTFFSTVKALWLSRKSQPAKNESYTVAISREIFLERFFLLWKLHGPADNVRNSLLFDWLFDIACSRLLVRWDVRNCSGREKTIERVVWCWDTLLALVLFQPRGSFGASPRSEILKQTELVKAGSSQLASLKMKAMFCLFTIFLFCSKHFSHS